MRMKGKVKSKMGRPPKPNKHGDIANFTLPNELGAQVRAYQKQTGITSLGEVYRQLVRMGLEKAKENKE
jgi:hypothetical protein